MREHALKILEKVFDKKVEFDRAQIEIASDLEPHDKAFLRRICFLIFRNKTALDRAIKIFTDDKKFEPRKLRYILYIGLAQLFYTEVPDHAAVDTTVDLAKASGCERQSGLINAVMRRAIREGMPDLDGVKAYPQWILSALKEAELTSLHENPALDMTFKNPATPDHTKELPLKSYRLQDGHPPLAELSGYDEGEWWIQDWSAALPVRLIKDKIQSVSSIVDVCAAPGGKTMQLASLGAKVTAVDISKNRLKRMEENIKRTNLDNQIDVIVSDALKWQPDEPVDIVLLDAPCSATGTIRRHPDLPWIKSPDDVVKLADLQSRLLQHVQSWLKPEGILVYCTCSILPEEGEQQIEEFLKTADFEVIKDLYEPLADELALSVSEYGCRVSPDWPGYEQGRDGFFIAPMQRVG